MLHRVCHHHEADCVACAHSQSAPCDAKQGLTAAARHVQDRIHRLGQYKPISVTRFIIAGTIEERILKLQEKKNLIFEGTIGKDAEALGKLTVDDLRFLFG